MSAEKVIELTEQEIEIQGNFKLVFISDKENKSVAFELINCDSEVEPFFLLLNKDETLKEHKFVKGKPADDISCLDWIVYDMILKTIFGKMKDGKNDDRLFLCLPKLCSFFGYEKIKEILNAKIEKEETILSFVDQTFDSCFTEENGEINHLKKDHLFFLLSFFEKDFVEKKIREKFEKKTDDEIISFIVSFITLSHEKPEKCDIKVVNITPIVMCLLVYAEEKGLKDLILNGVTIIIPTIGTKRVNIEEARETFLDFLDFLSFNHYYVEKPDNEKKDEKKVLKKIFLTPSNLLQFDYERQTEIVSKFFDQAKTVKLLNSTFDFPENFKELDGEIKTYNKVDTDAVTKVCLELDLNTDETKFDVLTKKYNDEFTRVYGESFNTDHEKKNEFIEKFSKARFHEPLCVRCGSAEEKDRGFTSGFGFIMRPVGKYFMKRDYLGIYEKNQWCNSCYHMCKFFCGSRTGDSKCGYVCSLVKHFYEIENYDAFSIEPMGIKHDSFVNYMKYKNFKALREDFKNQEKDSKNPRKDFKNQKGDFKNSRKDFKNQKGVFEYKSNPEAEAQARMNLAAFKKLPSQKGKHSQKADPKEEYDS
jgi:hypothetical protein